MSDAKERGIVHVIEETKTYGQKGFRKRMVVLEQDDGRFKNYIPFDFTNDGCDTVDDMNLGDEIEINYRLSGRKWQKDPQSEVKYFLNANAIGFKVIEAKPPGSASTPANARDANDRFSESAGADEEAPF